MTKKCRRCKTGEMTEITTTQDLNVRGMNIRVEGLLHCECLACGARVETPNQIDNNGEIMNEEILKLAEKCGLGDITVHGRLETKEEALGYFYRAAYNAGLEAAAGECERYAINTTHQDVAEAIRRIK